MKCVRFCIEVSHII